MRARVRRTAACAPHGTTRPHDLPQKSGERRYTGVEPATPTIHSHGPANPSVWGSPRDVAVCLQDNSPLAATSQTDHRRRPRRPARARSPRKHPDAAGGAPSSTESPDVASHGLPHAWCGPSDAHGPCDRCQPSGDLRPHSVTVDRGRRAERRRPQAPSTLAPSRCPSRRGRLPGRVCSIARGAGIR